MTRMLADDFHEICLICYFWKSSKIWNYCLLQIVGGPLWVKNDSVSRCFVEKEEAKRTDLGIDLAEVPLDLHDNQELADKGC